MAEQIPRRGPGEGCAAPEERRAGAAVADEGVPGYLTLIMICCQSITTCITSYVVASKHFGGLVDEGKSHGSLSKN